MLMSGGNGPVKMERQYGYIVCNKCLKCYTGILKFRPGVPAFQRSSVPAAPVRARPLLLTSLVWRWSQLVRMETYYGVPGKTCRNKGQHSSNLTGSRSLLRNITVVADRSHHLRHCHHHCHHHHHTTTGRLGNLQGGP